MRLRNVKNKEEILSSCKYLIENPNEYKGKWKELFNNDNPIYIEIGMGKGDFIIENAKTYKDINFIGIEKFDSVLARAIPKISDEIDNLLLIRMDALDIDDAFFKEIDRIYLNFSDPWPKNRHKNRRLSSNVFLSKYDTIFKDKCEIVLKTDNVSLFEYSVVSLSEYGYKIEQIYLDLHSHEEIPNIETEYERRFSNKGDKILYLKATK